MEFDCGCDNRREVMGAGEWKHDVLVIMGISFLVLLGIAISRK